MKPFVLFLFLVLALPERFRAPSLQEYVAQNHRVFRLSKPDNAFGDLLAEDIATHQVFFSSEEHAIAGNKVLEISLLRYLVKEAGVKYLLIEHGYCQAQWFAQYLATGDESILRAEVQRLEGTLSHTQEFFRYWQQVYQLNQELTPENKIQVVGIDLGWLPSVHPYVWQQAEGRNLTAFPSLAQFLARYHDSIPQAEWRATFEGIVSEFEANPGHSTFSAEQHFEIPYIFKNMLHSIEAFSQAEHLDIHRKRDGYMYKNFLELYPRLSPGKYFGQWGLNHVYQSPQLEVNWLAARLEHQEDSPVKGQVLSMATYYRGCERIRWRSTETETLDNLIATGDSLGLHFQPNSFHLVRLNGAQSPFDRELLWYGPHTPSSGVTTDYYDYLVVGNQLPSATPF